MPRYFFHVAEDGVLDELGEELDNLAAAKCHAVKYAGNLICDSAGEFWDRGDWKMTVTSESGLTLFELHFVGIEAAAILSAE